MNKADVQREDIRIQENGLGEMEEGPYYGLSSSDLHCVERTCSSSALGFYEISLILYKNSSFSASVSCNLTSS